MSIRVLDDGWWPLLPAIDYVQEKYLKQGDQSNESALEQMKDEQARAILATLKRLYLILIMQISDAIRNAYKSATGKDFFVPDKSWTTYPIGSNFCKHI